MSDRVKRSLTRFEDRLVTITRAVLRLTPLDMAAPLVFDRLPMPQGLSGDCLELVCDALAHGSALYLGQQGGWRRERFLKVGRPTEGRLWGRTPVTERSCVFSRHALDFLIAMTGHHPSHAKPWQPPIDELTPCDHLLVFLSYDAFRDSEAGISWRTQPVFARNPLNRLHFPDDFLAFRGRAPDYSAWVADIGGAILEVMQGALEERWLVVERGKREIGDWEQLQALARAQDLALEALLPALETANRRDLARFLLRSASRFCATVLGPKDLVGGLAGRGPARLADRYAVHKQAAVLPRVLERLAAWERQARTVSYLDDGYAAAQFWLQEWEAAEAGAALGHARAVLHQLEPLRLETKEQGREPRLSGAH